MAPYYPPPDPDKLLHPLLACLPIAFISSQPPPALLPLLSPILRQRVKLLAETRSTQEASWLSLLCWEAADAQELPSIVENISFEAHPVSGEMEFGEIERAQYRRLDEETLQSKTGLPDLELLAVYTWCTNDADGGDDGWRISEFKPLRSTLSEAGRPWYATFSEADERYESDGGTTARTTSTSNGTSHVKAADAEEQEEDDDAYWSQYDQRASETPAHSMTPAPRVSGKDADEDYYNRYDAVQPEMDAEDHSQDTEAVGESSLPGNILLQQHIPPTQSADQSDHIIHTRPSSSSSSAIAQLEQSAEHQSQAEIAIQQHISTSIKSLYRLTRGAGIDSTEFKRLVENELECLSLMDEE